MSDNTNEIILEVKDLKKSFGDHVVLESINTTVRKGEVIAIIGPSGCGKSTFLKSLNRMNDLVEGCKITVKVTLDGEDIYGSNMDVNVLRKKVGMVFQKPNPFPKSIFDNVAYGLRIHGEEDEDYIAFRAKRRYLPYYLSRSLDLNEFDQEKVTLRVVMGPQEKMFTKEGRETFLNSEYTVTSEFDRMGCRLEGPFIAYKTTSDIISDGIAFGSVQVPSHGKPIILLADRQTTGGYAKIATVISVDIPKLVQRKTEQKIRFQAVSVEEAQKLLADEMKELNDFRSQIYTPCKEVLDCRLVAKRVSTLFE